jgi:KaiC/GvpD/RAD55 family RecA-like ATPase
MFTERMRRISWTGEFDLGLPMPSESYQLLGAIGQLVQELAKPLVAVQGPEKINQKIAELAETEQVLAYVRERSDGRLHVDPQAIPIFRVSDGIKDTLIILVDFLVEESARMVGRIPEKEFNAILKARVADIVDRHSDLLIRFGLLDRLAQGMFTDRVSSGLVEFDLATKGGYPRDSAILLCGPPSDERNWLMDSFIGTGLARGDSCLYVTSAQPPENVQRQFGDLSSDLTIVDCYTSRIQEVNTISRSGNVITSPIEVSVVAVALSRAMDKKTAKIKRAVVDILPTYLVFEKIEKLYLDLMDLINDLRKSGYTAIFSLNPYYVKDEGAVSTLQELFDGVIHVERTADASGITGEISIRVEKMARLAPTKSAFKIQKPGQLEWRRSHLPSEIGSHATETTSAVEA